MITSSSHLIFEYQKGHGPIYDEKFKRISMAMKLEAIERLDKLDKQILDLVSEGDIITSLQLKRIIKNVADITIRRHIKKLYDLGCVDCFRPFTQNGTAPIHVVLGPVGASILNKENYRRMKKLTQNWRHIVAVNEVYSQLSEKFHIKTWKTELQFKWEDESTREKQQRADAFMVYINKNNQEKYAMIEVDMGTEELSRLMDKITDYIEYFNTSDAKKAYWQPYKSQHKYIIPEIIFIMKNEKDAVKLRGKCSKLQSNVTIKIATFDSISKNK